MLTIKVVMRTLSITAFANLFSILSEYYPDANIRLKPNYGTETFLLELPKQEFEVSDHEFFVALDSRGLINSWGVASYL